MKISSIAATCTLSILLSAATFCQTEAGHLFFEGSSHLNLIYSESNSKSDDTDNYEGKKFSFELAPQIGFFIFKGFAAGFETYVSYEYEKSNQYDKKNKSAGFSTFLKYYIGSGTVKPYFTGGVGYGLLKSEYDYLDQYHDEQNSSVLLTYFGSGAAIFLNDKSAIEIGLFYQHNKTQPTKENPENYRTISGGVVASIGFVIVL